MKGIGALIDIEKASYGTYLHRSATGVRGRQDGAR